MMRFKFIYDRPIPIQNGDVKRVWTLTHNYGYWSYNFLVIKKRIFLYTTEVLK